MNDSEEIKVLRAQLAEAHALLEYTEGQLTNLQPHIEQACYPGRSVFIDNYVDPVIERIRTLSASAEPSAPVEIDERAAIGLVQVLRAYDYAQGHPHRYLIGTTNWCAAVAHSLNEQARAALPRK